MKPFLAVLFLLGLTSSVLGYDAKVSPKCTVCILNQDDKPIVGLTIKREWDGSDNNKGEDEAITDKDGKVTFQKVVIKRSVLKRIFKPLLIFVPASCGPEWETYSSTQITINWPGAYDLKPLPEGFKPHDGGFQDKDGTVIRDPKVVEKWFLSAGGDLSRNFIQFYFFDRKKNTDFSLTLHVSKRSAGQ